MTPSARAASVWVIPLRFTNRSTRVISGSPQVRLRNYSLNLFFGWKFPVNQYRVGKNNLLDTNYYQFSKESDMDQVNPSKLFTFVDTSPVSVCYPGFVVAMSTLAAWHRPSVEHQKYGVVAFADSHVESPHWMNKQTVELAHTPTTTGPLPDPNWNASTGSPDGDHVRFVLTGANEDIEWFRQRASVKK